jgi:hypothetical protein
VAGELLLGPVGAIVGAVAGSGGKTTFLMELASGERWVCQCSPGDYAGILAGLHNVMSERGRAPFNWFLAIVGGPLYTARYGIPAFLLVAVLTLFTYGLAWPFVSVISRYLDRREAELAEGHA